MGSILVVILILILLVIVHEFGHFLVAKLFGIRVDEFGVFFPPRIFGWKLGETTYTLNWIPLGGFVKIFGETTDENDTSAADEPRSFINKSRWVQACVILAGIVFNILFAWLALSACYMVGMQSAVEHKGVGTVQNAHVTITTVLPKSPAEAAGLKPNDVITGVQTATAVLPQNADADQVQKFIEDHQNESIIFHIAGEKENPLAKPVDGLVPGHKAVGIAMDDVGILQLSPPLALVQGAVLTQEVVVETGQGLWHIVSSLFHGKPNLTGVAGPIGIVSIGSTFVKEGITASITLMALISISLAIGNLIPIPGLDGGRLLFIIIEGIRGRAMSEKLAFRLTIVGFAVLLLIMFAASYHDILNILHPTI